MGSTIVVGGGILGVSTAWRLAEAGHKTTLIESAEMGGTATRASFSWLNSGRKSPLPYHRLNVAGMNHYRRLQVEMDSPRWLHFDGRIEWDDSPAGTGRLIERVESLAAWEYGSEILPVSELKHLEPDLAAPDSVTEFAYFAQEGYIDPLAMMGDMVRRAKALGATIRTQTPVTEFVKHGDQIQGVISADGEQILADNVVLCTGAIAPTLLSTVGYEFPMAPTHGLVAVTSPSMARLRSVLISNNLSMRPDGAGRMMLRHYDFDKMLTSSTSEVPTPGFLNDLLERATRVLPALASSRIDEARIAIRPIPADGKPVIGPVPGARGLYLMVCHSGVTMGPLLAHIAAREISTNYVDARLTDFRPHRTVIAPGQSSNEN